MYESAEAELEMLRCSDNEVRETEEGNAVAGPTIKRSRPNQGTGRLAQADFNFLLKQPIETKVNKKSGPIAQTVVNQTLRLTSSGHGNLLF